MTFTMNVQNALFLVLLASFTVCAPNIVTAQVVIDSDEVTYAVDWAKDSLLVTAHENGVKLWSFPGGKLLAHRKTGMAVWSLAVSSDRSLLATGGGDSGVASEMVLWQLPSLRRMRAFTGPRDYVQTVDLSADGKRIIAGSYDQQVGLWDVGTGEQVFRWKGHTGNIIDVAFSTDASVVASASSDKTVRIWDARSGLLLRKLSGHSSSVYGVAFSPNKRAVVTTSLDKTVVKWDLATGQPTAQVTMTSRHGYWHDVAFSPDGRFLAGTIGDGRVAILDYATGKRLATLGKATRSLERVANVSFSPDGEFLAAAGGNFTVRVWRMSEVLAP